MCGGVEYTYHGETIKTYFPNPETRLPIRQKTGEVVLVPWGRRKEQPSEFPLGGWARLDSIEKGVWDRYFPKPVKIIVDRFMEKDINRKSHWFDMKASAFIQGLLVQHKQEQRVYVVTIEGDEDAVHDRWPRIITDLKL